MNVVQLFLENKADPNIHGHELSEALQKASAADRRDIVQLLVECGADPHQWGDFYHTAFDAAMARGDRESVELLKHCAIPSMIKKDK